MEILEFYPKDFPIYIQIHDSICVDFFINVYLVWTYKTCLWPLGILSLPVCF